MKNFSDDTIVCRKDLSASRLQDEIVMFDDNAGKYYATGSVGADIWEMLEQPVAVSAIVRQLLANYDIDEKTCREQVLSFLGELDDAALLVL